MADMLDTISITDGLRIAAVAIDRIAQEDEYPMNEDYVLDAQVAVDTLRAAYAKSMLRLMRGDS